MLNQPNISQQVAASLARVESLKRQLADIESARTTHPVIRQLLCPWCWRALRIARFFPSAWSSSICIYHDRMMRKQSAARRARRQSEVM